MKNFKNNPKSKIPSLLNMDPELRKLIRENFSTVPLSTISRWSTQRLYPPVPVLEFMASYKNTNIAYLLGETDIDLPWELTEKVDRSLEEILNEKDMKVSTFARKINGDLKITKGYLDELPTRVNSLLAIAEGLNVSIDYLLGHTNWKSWEDYHAMQNPLDNVKPGHPIYIVKAYKISPEQPLSKAIELGLGSYALLDKDGKMVLFPNGKTLSKEQLSTSDIYIIEI